MDDDETVPVDEIYFETVFLHGRVYQTYSIENGVYFAPIDEDEIERLQILHAVFQRLFDGRLIFPPIRGPRTILECGFGTASWAIDVALQHPNCDVTAVDICSLMAPEPENLPGNLALQIDDLNRPFTFRDNEFDVVHSQMVAGGIHANRWDSYLRDIHRVLRPGGWCQMVEIYFNAQSDNGTLTNNHALRRWSRRFTQSMQPMKDPRAALQLETHMRNAGFVDVGSMAIPLHMSGWSSDAREHEIGTENRANVHRLLASLAILPFTEVLGMSETDVQLLVAQARNEADNPAFKAYFPVYVCTGRKRR